MPEYYDLAIRMARNVLPKTRPTRGGPPSHQFCRAANYVRRICHHAGGPVLQAVLDNGDYKAVARFLDNHRAALGELVLMPRAWWDSSPRVVQLPCPERQHTRRGDTL